MAAILNLKIRHLNGNSQDDNIRKWIQHTQIRLKKVVVDFSSNVQANDVQAFGLSERKSARRSHTSKFKI